MGTKIEVLKFLLWLKSRGIVLAEESSDSESPQEFYPISKSNEKLVAEYRLNTVREKLDKRLAGRGTLNLSEMAKRAHSLEHITQDLKHLDHAKDDSVPPRFLGTLQVEAMADQMRDQLKNLKERK